MELTRVPGLRLLGEILHFELRPSGLFDRRELVKSGHIALPALFLYSTRAEPKPPKWVCAMLVWSSNGGLATTRPAATGAMCL